MTEPIPLPDMAARHARIVARLKAERATEEGLLAAVRAERAEWVRKARATLRHPEHMPAQILRDACAVLQAWGDGTDWLEADAMIFALDKCERIPARDAERSTAAQIAFRHINRLPEIIAWAVALVACVWLLMVAAFSVSGLP
jgi:hypothetical protein